MIITLAGAPGNGKNGIISSLKEHGYNVVSKVGADGTISGQFELMAHYKREMDRCNVNKDVAIFESSFIDIIVYTALWIGYFDDIAEDITTLTKRCIELQEKYIDLNFNLYADTSDTTYHSEQWNAIANLYYRKIHTPFYLLEASKGIEYNTNKIIEAIEEHASK